MTRYEQMNTYIAQSSSSTGLASESVYLYVYIRLTVVYWSVLFHSSFFCCCFFVYARGMIAKSLKIVPMCVCVCMSLDYMQQAIAHIEHYITVAQQQVRYILCSLSFITVPHTFTTLVFSVRLTSFHITSMYITIHVYIDRDSFFFLFCLVGCDQDT